MTNLIGYNFEQWVKNLYKDLGKYKVKHNITLEKKNVKAQFDITFGLFKTHYIECKYRSKNKKIKFSEMATFAGKLDLFNIPYKRGIFITNTTFNNRSKLYAKTLGIKLYDRKGLYKLHRRRRNIFYKMVTKYDEKSLEKIIKKV